MGRPRKRLKQAETVAVGCDPLPLNLGFQRRLSVKVHPRRFGQPFALLLVAVAAFLVAENASSAV
jgi:hypothetical protein